MPADTLENVRAARAEADAIRAEWLLSITDDILTVPELIEHAVTDQGVPLRKITLRQLLLAQPKWGRKRTKAVLERLRSTLATDMPETKMTVGWLIDPRHGGKNMLAWIDCFTPRQDAPWTGFPFARMPEVLR